MEETKSTNLGSSDWLSIGEAAKYLRLSRDTLRRWERTKIIKSYRSPTNHRYYKREELDYVFSQKPEVAEKTNEQKQTVPTVKTNSRYPLIIIGLLTVYVVILIFLIWLVLRTG